jgi:hypothetical protein
MSVVGLKCTQAKFDCVLNRIHYRQRIEKGRLCRHFYLFICLFNEWRSLFSSAK